jgi:phospholipid transport system substrate-binding protein
MKVSAITGLALAGLLTGGIATGRAAAPTPAATAAAGVTALDQTRKTLDKTRVIIDSDRPHNDKLAALHALLEGFLDTDTMGRTALDQHWGKFTAGQQKEFLKLFRELFQRTYVQKLLLFDRPDFEYVGQESEGDHIRVDTKILTPRDDFAVTYQFRQRGEAWAAFDIRIEDLSLTTNFRRQLDRLLAKTSPASLLDRMRRKYGASGAEDSGAGF